MEQQHRNQHKDVQERRQDDLEEIQHGPFPVEQLQDSGLYTVESVMYAPRKDLVQIKGISEAKVDKIIEAGLSFSVLTTSCFTRCCNYAYQQTNLTNTNQQLQNWCPWALGFTCASQLHAQRLEIIQITSGSKELDKVLEGRV
ncbi:unnamed protein product [Cuscuta campestris]|uniref:Uncharacterized protein n=1 Tax=Cuscuta campestris TaxID=132261 RepID=A0A484NA65_9ASTE|nr:unnamed protein product [Cuscuta campestris]